MCSQSFVSIMTAGMVQARSVDGDTKGRVDRSAQEMLHSRAEIGQASHLRSRTDLDMVLVNIEAAVRIKKRSDFFSWVQGVFQGMLAHEVLVCGLPVPPASSLQFDWLGSFPIAERSFADLCRPDRGVMPPLISLWRQAGGVPLVLRRPLAAQASPLVSSVLEELQKQELDNVVAHGLWGFGGQPACFFAFFKLRSEAGDAEARALELLLPYLHSGWLRANVAETDPANTMLGPQTILTSREAEILRWVEKGKSNNEIAQILSISHLTVKNHVQKILRKLNAQNRAQAVARGIALNLTSRY